MPIEQLFSILRNHRNFEASWSQVLNILEEHTGRSLWQSLAQVPFDANILRMHQWLELQLADIAAPTGVYLGLDTLNMDQGQGKNIDIGWTTCDTRLNQSDWIYGQLTHGESVFLDGLYQLHQIYSLAQWQSVYPIADYMLFLGYSGLIVLEAIAQAQSPYSRLYTWGFHDGDMFLLARSHSGQTDIICQ
ncbi:hypothetical protein [Amphibiibacter pelophylacis]|uniref:Uncharacterized protein n=1 Tax=Amphibiibacter pelophylacis TaxID=1799477 RepID=A0ACC6P0T6_9BURK